MKRNKEMKKWVLRPGKEKEGTARYMIVYRMSVGKEMIGKGDFRVSVEDSEG